MSTFYTNLKCSKNVICLCFLLIHIFLHTCGNIQNSANDCPILQCFYAFFICQDLPHTLSYYAYYLKFWTSFQNSEKHYLWHTLDSVLPIEHKIPFEFSLRSRNILNIKYTNRICFPIALYALSLIYISSLFSKVFICLAETTR